MVCEQNQLLASVSDFRRLIKPETRAVYRAIYPEFVTSPSGKPISMTLQISFDNSYARLPERFYARVLPARFPAPKFIRLNRELAASLGLDPDWLQSSDGLEVLSGQLVAEGSEPIALSYAGHQFGNFV